MREGQEEVRKEAARLGNSLTNAPKARGRWGEQALKNVLESCGLSEHTDFALEHSVNTEEGRLRPDAIISVPGQKKLIIDAKVSLNAYQQAYEADTDEGRKTALDAHARSMRNHVQQLGTKSYQSQFEDAPDYVVMFVPGEHFVAAALDARPYLVGLSPLKSGCCWQRLPISWPSRAPWHRCGARTRWRRKPRLSAGWRRTSTTALRWRAEHLKRVGSGLETAVGNYNKFVGSYERNVISAARKLRDKGIETGKREVDDVPLVESAPRYLAADLAAETSKPETDPQPVD